AYAARRVRLDRADQHLPMGLVLLLVVGALVIESFITLIASPSNRVERTMAVLANGLIGLTLALALVLDYPFAGQLGVDDKPFTLGALAPSTPDVTAALAAHAAQAHAAK